MDTVLLYTSFFLRNPLVLPAFCVTTALIAFALLRQKPRHLRAISGALSFAASLALIVAFTWLPDSGNVSDLTPGHWDITRIPLELSGPVGLGAWRYGTDGPLNVLLYVPAGITVATHARNWQRSLSTAPRLAALSLATEIWQALTGTRSGSLNDVASNTIGAMLGLAAALILKAAVHRMRRRRLHPTSKATTDSDTRRTISSALSRTDNSDIDALAAPAQATTGAQRPR